MKFIYKIPGYMLLLFGGFCLSWGGFIVRSFETTNTWEILLLRSSFFFLAISTFLLLIYKKDSAKILSSEEDASDARDVYFSFNCDTEPL